MSHETIESIPVDVVVVNAAELHPDDSFIDGAGFTLRIEATDGPTKLLSEDPLRLRAWITSNVGLHIGTRQSLSTLSGLIGVNTNTPGARLDSSAAAVEIKAQSEVWGIVEAAGLVGVWVERKTIRSTR